MKKFFYKLYLIIALVVLPTAVFADYPSCTNNGGGFWWCFYQAAMNDRIAPPTGDGQPDTDRPIVKYSEAQIKASFDRNNQYCSKLAVEKQFDCLSRGMVAEPTGKLDIEYSQPTHSYINRKITKTVSEPNSRPLNR